jgi:hypothetical protein
LDLVERKPPARGFELPQVTDSLGRAQIEKTVEAAPVPGRDQELPDRPVFGDLSLLIHHIAASELSQTLYSPLNKLFANI